MSWQSSVWTFLTGTEQHQILLFFCLFVFCCLSQVILEVFLLLKHSEPQEPPLSILLSLKALEERYCTFKRS